MPPQPLTVLLLDISKTGGKDAELHQWLKERGFQIKPMRDQRRSATLLRRGDVQIAVIVTGKRTAHPLDEVLLRLREGNDDVPVLVISPTPNLEEAQILIRGGAYDYVGRNDLEGGLGTSLTRAIEEKGYTLSQEERLSRLLGQRLRQARTEKGLTLKQLSTRAGLSISLISQVELHYASPSVATLFKLSRALHLPLQDLFAGF